MNAKPQEMNLETFVFRIEADISSITVLWDVIPCSLVDWCQRFRRTCYPYRQLRKDLLVCDCVEFDRLVPASRRNPLNPSAIMKMDAAGSYETLVTVCQIILCYIPHISPRLTPKIIKILHILLLRET